MSKAKIGKRQTFTSMMSDDLCKMRQWFVVFRLVGELAEELRILRQTQGITSGEKKAIAAMLDKLGRFNVYGVNCLSAARSSAE